MEFAGAANIAAAAKRSSNAGRQPRDRRILFLSSIGLWLRIQRVLALLVEFVLQLEADVIGFPRADRFHNSIDPPIHLKLSQLLRRHGSDARIMVRKPRVPPDAGVNIVRKILVMLVSTGFSSRAVDMYGVRASDHHLRRFIFAGVPVDDGTLLRWSP